MYLLLRRRMPVRYFRSFLVIGMLVTALSLFGCSPGGINRGEGVTIGTPIELTSAQQGIQESIGLSGFIFGTFLLLNAYVIIMAGCALLIIKDDTVKKLLDWLDMALQLTGSSGEKGFPSFVSMLAQQDTRQLYGTIALTAGLLLAYLGAWIAL